MLSTTSTNPLTASNDDAQRPVLCDWTGFPLQLDDREVPLQILVIDICIITDGVVQKVGNRSEGSAPTAIVAHMVVRLTSKGVSEMDA